MNVLFHEKSVFKIKKSFPTIKQDVHVKGFFEKNVSRKCDFYLLQPV